MSTTNESNFSYFIDFEAIDKGSWHTQGGWMMVSEKLFEFYNTDSRLKCRNPECRKNNPAYDRCEPRYKKDSGGTYGGDAGKSRKARSYKCRKCGRKIQSQGYIELVLELIPEIKPVIKRLEEEIIKQKPETHTQSLGRLGDYKRATGNRLGKATAAGTDAERASPVAQRQHKRGAVSLTGTEPVEKRLVPDPEAEVQVEGTYPEDERRTKYVMRRPTESGSESIPTSASVSPAVMGRRVAQIGLRRPSSDQAEILSPLPRRTITLRTEEETVGTYPITIPNTPVSGYDLSSGSSGENEEEEPASTRSKARERGPDSAPAENVRENIRRAYRALELAAQVTVSIRKKLISLNSTLTTLESEIGNATTDLASILLPPTEVRGLHTSHRISGFLDTHFAVKLAHQLQSTGDGNRKLYYTSVERLDIRIPSVQSMPFRAPFNAAEMLLQSGLDSDEAGADVFTLRPYQRYISSTVPKLAEKARSTGYRLVIFKSYYKLKAQRNRLWQMAQPPSLRSKIEHHIFEITDCVLGIICRASDVSDMEKSIGLLGSSTARLMKKSESRTSYENYLDLPSIDEKQKAVLSNTFLFDIVYLYCLAVCCMRYFRNAMPLPMVSEFLPAVFRHVQDVGKKKEFDKILHGLETRFVMEDGDTLDLNHVSEDELNNSTGSLAAAAAAAGGGASGSRIV